MTDAIKGPIKDFIMNEFLPGEDPNELTDSTPLISGGILDSLGDIARLVASKNPRLPHASA